MRQWLWLILLPQLCSHPLLRGHLVESPLRPRAGGVGGADVAAEEEVERDAHGDGRDDPDGDLERQVRHGVRDPDRDGVPQRDGQRPDGEPGPAPLRVVDGPAPQEVELAEAAVEQREEVVGGDDEGQVPPAVPRPVHGPREGRGDRQREDRWDGPSGPVRAGGRPRALAQLRRLRGRPRRRVSRDGVGRGGGIHVARLRRRRPRSVESVSYPRKGRGAIGVSEEAGR